MELYHDTVTSHFSVYKKDLFSFEWKIENLSSMKYDSSVLSPMFYLLHKEHLYYLKLIRNSRVLFSVNLYNKANEEIGIDFTITLSQNHGKSFYTNTDSVDSFSSLKELGLISKVRFPLYCDVVYIACFIKVIGGLAVDNQLEPMTPHLTDKNHTSASQNEHQCTSNQVGNNSAQEEKYKMIQKTAPDSKEKIPTYKSLQTESAPDDSPDFETLKQLSIDLKRMFNQAINTDVTIRIEDSTIKAHKTILCARSPVFFRMFEHSTLEAMKNEIEVTDIRASTMKKLVDYLYSGGKRSLQYEEACELYYAADKYEILNLREACVKDLLRVLDVNNACPMLSLANCHGDDVFKDKIMHFISENFKVIVNTEAWIELTEKDTKLAAYLMRYCALALTQ